MYRASLLFCGSLAKSGRVSRRGCEENYEAAEDVYFKQFLVTLYVLTYPNTSGENVGDLGGHYPDGPQDCWRQIV